MAKTLITTTKDSFTFTIKNLCTLHFNKSTDHLTFISPNLNLNTQVHSWYNNYKSFGFVYDQVYPQLSDEARQFAYIISKDNKTLVFHKSIRNEYLIKQGVGKFKDYVYVTVPSKIFMKFRYAIYDTQRKYLNDNFDSLPFSCGCERFRIRCDHTNGKITLRKSDNKFIVITEEEVDSYICKANFIILFVGNKQYHLYEHITRSFKVKDFYFSRLHRSPTKFFDVAEYFKLNPYILEDEQVIISAVETNDFNF